MIVTRRMPAEFKQGGYTLVQATDVAHYERFGVPLYMGRNDAGRASGPWAPRWALSLLAALSPVPLGGEGALLRAIGHALRQDDPEEFARAADASARLGGLPALEALLAGAPT